MKKNKRVIGRILIWLVSLTVVFAAVLILVGRFITSNIGDDAEPPTVKKDKAAEETKESEQIDASETDEEKIVYPSPSYEFKTDEVVVEIEGLEKEYTIAFVNDMHMITDHVSGNVTEDNMAVVRERYETLSVTEEGIHSEELWPEVIKFLNYNDFDAVVFAGDILDYCSNSNIKVLKTGLDELKYSDDRVMYLRSDHDYGGWYGGAGFTDSNGFNLQRFVLDSDDTEKVIEFDGFMIVGINQSYRNLSEQSRAVIDENLDKGKPVLIATHVPFYSEVDDSLEELSMEVRNRIYYWSEDGGSYVPDAETQALIDRMYAEDSNVEQILAAHMHSSWDGYVTDRLKEHIFAPSFQGNIGIIHVRSVEDENQIQTGKSN